MKRKWCISPQEDGLIHDGSPGCQHQLLHGFGEWMDFTQKGDAFTVFLRLPAHVDVHDVFRVMSRFGSIINCKPFGSDQSLDGSWQVWVAYFSAQEAVKAVSQLNTPSGRALWGKAPESEFLSESRTVLSTHRDLLRARLGAKRGAQGGGEEEGFLTSQQDFQMLNSFLPFQWSNTIDCLEVNMDCAPKKKVPIDGGKRLLPGGITALWSDEEQAFLPQPKDLLLHGVVDRVDFGEMAASQEFNDETETALKEEEISKVFDTELIQDERGLAREQGRYDDLLRRNPDICTSAALDSAMGIKNIPGFRVKPALRFNGPKPPLALPDKRLVPMKGPPPTSSSNSQPLPFRPPCIFVRQGIFLHNPDGTSVLSVSSGGCLCRHREEKPLITAFQPLITLPSRPYLTAASASVALSPPPCVAALDESDMALPLSQQPDSLTVENSSKQRRSTRGHLKSRRWTSQEVLEGIPTKFTASESFRRACDRLRIWVPRGQQSF